MHYIDDVLEIVFAINRQSRTQLSDVIPETKKTIETAIQKAGEESKIEKLVGKEKEPMNRLEERSENIFKEKESLANKFIYNPFKVLSQYFNELKNKAYEYYTEKKSEIKEKFGYTDKLLMEFEDWGVIYYKSAFKKLVRLTPMGKMQRYLQKLWICISKSVK